MRILTYLNSQVHARKYLFMYVNKNILISPYEKNNSGSKCDQVPL